MWGARGIAFSWEEIKEMVSTGLGSQNGIPGGRTCISRGRNAQSYLGDFDYIYRAGEEEAEFNTGRSKSVRWSKSLKHWPPT